MKSPSLTTAVAFNEAKDPVKVPAVVQPSSPFELVCNSSLPSAMDLTPETVTAKVEAAAPLTFKTSSAKDGATGISKVIEELAATRSLVSLI